MNGIVGAWRRSASLRWCLRHPLTYRGFRRLGHREPRVVATLARWFRPDQVRRLGWHPTAVSRAAESMARVPGEGWDAEAFVGVVLATGRDHTGHLTNWHQLHRLGVHDPTDYLRYVTDDLDVALALRYALGPERVPYDVALALKRRGATRLWALLGALQREYLDHRTDYWGGWTTIVAWIEYDDSAGFQEALAPRYVARDDAPYASYWRRWRRVAERTTRLEPALFAAAGFTVEEALGMLDAGTEPDAEALRGLAALRRTG